VCFHTRCLYETDYGGPEGSTLHHTMNIALHTDFQVWRKSVTVVFRFIEVDWLQIYWVRHLSTRIRVSSSRVPLMVFFRRCRLHLPENCCHVPFVEQPVWNQTFGKATRSPLAMEQTRIFCLPHGLASTSPTQICRLTQVGCYRSDFGKRSSGQALTSFLTRVGRGTTNGHYVGSIAREGGPSSHTF